MPNFSATAANIWAVADLLRGDFKQSQYGRVILPFTLLRRLECVLEPTKAAVLKAAKSMGAWAKPLCLSSGRPQVSSSTTSLP